MGRIRYVTFPTLHAEPLTIAARLSAPEGAGPHPAVILLHDDEGPGERENAHAAALNAAGFLTLEPDLCTPRDPAGDRGACSAKVHEILPDLFGARRFLADRTEVQSGAIGVLGFGSGGAAALLAATTAIDQAFPEDGGFAGFLAFYPVCHRFNRLPGFEFSHLVHAPILIATATLDGYDDDRAAGPALAGSLPPMDRAKVRTAIFYGVHHGFDAPGPDREIEDPDAHRGQGGAVTLRYDPEAGGRARGLVVQFFGEMRDSRRRERPQPRRSAAALAWNP